jgi:hypothetical protein
MIKPYLLQAMMNFGHGQLTAVIFTVFEIYHKIDYDENK